MSETVEITAKGDLRLSASTAAQYFPADSLVALWRSGELWLLPLTGPEGGGLLLKQRNAAGDRSTLIWEALPEKDCSGVREAVWDEAAGALRVDLGEPHE